MPISIGIKGIIVCKSKLTESADLEVTVSWPWTAKKVVGWPWSLIIFLNYVKSRWQNNHKKNTLENICKYLILLFTRYYMVPLKISIIVVGKIINLRSRSLTKCGRCSMLIAEKKYCGIEIKLVSGCSKIAFWFQNWNRNILFSFKYKDCKLGLVLWLNKLFSENASIKVRYKKY